MWGANTLCAAPPRPVCVCVYAERERRPRDRARTKKKMTTDHVPPVGDGPTDPAPPEVKIDKGQAETFSSLPGDTAADKIQSAIADNKWVQCLGPLRVEWGGSG